jgi:acetyl esterase
MTQPISEQPIPSGWRGALFRAGLACLRASLRVSPRPMVWVIRRQFAESGQQLAATLRPHSPTAVTSVLDERYGSHRDERLDAFTPDRAAREGARLPTLVWTHGGGWIGGDKDEMRDYLKLIAAAGFTVVGLNYPLAPQSRYPTPTRSVMTALQHLCDNADRLHVDASQFLLAGDSAGAHITAQVAAIATNPDYGNELGIPSTIASDQLRGVALHCGPYDLSLVSPDSPMHDFILTVAWSYSGTRNFRSDAQFMSTMDITSHVTGTYPTTFITVGNADPLAPHSYALASMLEANGVAVDPLFYPTDHQPALGHEYQFDPNSDEGQTARNRLIAFLQRRTNASSCDQ